MPGLMSIPPELRLHIYSYLADTTIRPGDPETFETGPLAILRTCRQVHDEAGQIFYAKGTWRLVYIMAELPLIAPPGEGQPRQPWRVDVADWLTKIGPANLAALNKVRLEEDLLGILYFTTDIRLRSRGLQHSHTSSRPPYRDKVKQHFGEILDQYSGEKGELSLEG